MVEALDRHSVDYLVVGGIATRAYGAKRPTGDFDCLLRRTVGSYDGENINVVSTANGTPDSGAMVTARYMGSTENTSAGDDVTPYIIGTTTTDSNGAYAFEWTPTSAGAPGQHEIRVWSWTVGGALYDHSATNTCQDSAQHDHAQFYAQGTGWFTSRARDWTFSAGLSFAEPFTGSTFNAKTTSGDGTWVTLGWTFSGGPGYLCGHTTPAQASTIYTRP